jgi:hypothetical protein
MRSIVLMEAVPRQSGISNSPDQESANLLGLWRNRAGVEREKMRLDINRQLHHEVNDDTFKTWFTNKRVSARSRDALGERVVALVNWFVKRHMFEVSHYQTVVVTSDELETFLRLYPEISPMHQLQVRRRIYELNPMPAEELQRIFLPNNWQEQFRKWQIFALVMDRYWCVRAYTRYSLELAGFRPADAVNWHWWQRLALGVGGRTKFEGQSSMLSLRGPFADTYYLNQLIRFRTDTAELVETKRYQALMHLLQHTTGFMDRWLSVEQALTAGRAPLQTPIPVPFFRADGTAIWMLEVSAAIPDTALTLIVRLETDAVTSEYVAGLRHRTDSSTHYDRDAYFIEDFAHHFTPEQRFALGVDG